MPIVNLPPEPTGYAATAAELRRIADALDTLPPVDKPPYVQLSVLPEHTVEAVDTVALAVLGKPGQREMPGRECVHVARHFSSKTNMSVTVQASVPDPRDVELERLRAELAALKPAADPDHGRTTAVAAAKPDTLMVPHGDPHRTDPTGGESGWRDEATGLISGGLVLGPFKDGE